MRNRTIQFLAFGIFIFISFINQAQIATFTQVGPVKFPRNPSVQTTGMGRVCQLVFHPTDSNILFAVSSSGGVWRSINKGATWKSLTDGMPSTTCASLLINPLNPNTMYLGTGDPNYYSNGLGLWKTTDAGKTWYQIAKGLGTPLIAKMVMHPNDTNTIVIATPNGIYKSTNSGASWKKTTSFTASYRDILIKPKSGNTLYACSYQYVFYSTNFGDSWSKLVLNTKDTMDGIIMAVTPADSNVVYAAGWRKSGKPSYFGGVFKSTNSAVSFTKEIDTPQIMGYDYYAAANNGQGGYNLGLAADPINASTIYLGAINIWKSINSGKNWTIKSHWVYGVHADKHGMEYSPFNSKELYVNHDGGLDRSSDGGNTWTTLSDGLSASEFYTLGQSVTKREICIGGLQDNGVDLYKNKVMYTVQGGDGTDDFVFDNKDTSNFYQESSSWRRNANTLQWDNVNSTGIIEMHATDTNSAFCGLRYLKRTKNLRATPASISWTKISDSVVGVSYATLNSISSSEKSVDLLYYSDYYWRLFRSDNIMAAKPTYTTLSPPDNTTYVTEVKASPFDINKVYITQNTKMYISGNKGKTWVSMSNGLPGTFIIKFVIDKYDPDTGIYAATYNGIYYKNNKMPKWKLFSSGMPSICNISDLEIFNDSTPNSCIRVATFGRGIWQSSLYRDLHKLPISDFTINSTSSASCSNTFILNNLSQGAITSSQWIISPAGYTYLNGSDSTSRNPEIMFTKSGVYYVSLKVGNAAGTDIKTQQINISTLNKAAVCNPTTITPCCYTIGVYRFELNTIDNSSNYTTYNTKNIEDYTCSQSTILKPGGTYTAYITGGTANNEYAKLYIDYNNNGNFKDAGELVGSLGAGKGRRGITFTVPSSPKVIDTFLRLRVIDDFYAISGACATLGYGEAEDYSIMIDSSRPKVDIIAPIMTSSSYQANFKLNMPVTKFDSSMINVSNATLSHFIQIDPLNYMATIRPIYNRTRIVLSIKANVISSLNGMSNFAASDSTAFFLGFKSYNINTKSASKKMVSGNFGDNYYFNVPFGTKIDSLKSHFVLSDTSKAFIKNILQVSDTSINNYTYPIVYKIIAKDTNVVMYDTIHVIQNKDTACTMFSYNFKKPSSIGKFSGDSILFLLPASTDVTNLIANYKASANANVSVNGIGQKSDTSINDFSNPTLYLVTAQDTAYHKQYVVKVNLSSVTGLRPQSPKAKNFTLYPNPTKGEIFLEFSSPVKFATISLLNPKGEILQKQESCNAKIISINLNSLAQGVYYLRIETAQGSYLKEIVKE